MVPKNTVEAVAEFPRLSWLVLGGCLLVGGTFSVAFDFLWSQYVWANGGTECVLVSGSVFGHGRVVLRKQVVVLLPLSLSISKFFVDCDYFFIKNQTLCFGLFAGI